MSVDEVSVSRTVLPMMLLVASAMLAFDEAWLPRPSKSS